jgi:glutamate synthase (NADPH/NADH)
VVSLTLTQLLCCLSNTLSRGINEGRQTAREVDLYLEGMTSLPVTGGIVKRSAEEILAKHAQGRA